jgi:dTDP-4-dehydrorhamnose reductase
MIGTLDRVPDLETPKNRDARGEVAIMRILVTGASGRLGSALIDRLTGERRHEIVAWSGTTRGRSVGIPLLPVDLCHAPAILESLEAADPDAVIHAGAVSSADAVYRGRTRARAVNVEATRFLAAWAASRGRRLVFTSTDLVFDGSKSWYREDDPARPILAYGRTKSEAERFVLVVPGGLVARLSLLFGSTPSGRLGFIDLAIDALRRGEPRPFFEDEFRTPLDYRTAADILVRLVESEAVGIVHVGGPERLSRFELMRRAALAAGVDPHLVRSGRQADAILPEPRPADVSLDTSRLAALLPAIVRPSVEAALGDSCSL